MNMVGVGHIDQRTYQCHMHYLFIYTHTTYSITLVTSICVYTIINCWIVPTNFPCLFIYFFFFWCMVILSLIVTVNALSMQAQWEVNTTQFQRCSPLTPGGLCAGTWHPGGHELTHRGAHTWSPGGLGGSTWPPRDQKIPNTQPVSKFCTCT